MHMHGTYGSPDIAIAIYTCTFIHTHTIKCLAHTHTCTCSAGHDKRHSNKIRNYSQRAAVKSCSRSQKQQQPWHITNTQPHAHTHTRATHACKTWAAASPSSLYHNLRERLKSLWGVVKYKNEKNRVHLIPFWRNSVQKRQELKRVSDTDRHRDWESASDSADRILERSIAKLYKKSWIVLSCNKENYFLYGVSGIKKARSIIFDCIPQFELC